MVHFSPLIRQRAGRDGICPSRHGLFMRAWTDFVVASLGDANHDLFRWSPVVRVVKELETPE